MFKTKRFASKLSVAQAAEVDEWWRGLKPRDRRELRGGTGRPPPRVVARFVEPGDPNVVTDDFYEYLVNHEITIDDGPKYHVCSAHPEARNVLGVGRIPVGFRCPRGEKACPMRILLDQRPGHDVQLSLDEGR